MTIGWNSSKEDLGTEFGVAAGFRKLYPVRITGCMLNINFNSARTLHLQQKNFAWAKSGKTCKFSQRNLLIAVGARNEQIP